MPPAGSPQDGGRLGAPYRNQLHKVYFAHLSATPLPNCPIVISPLVWLHLAPTSPIGSPPVMSKGQKGKGYFFLVPSPTGMAQEKESLTLAALSASFPGLGA